MSGEDGAFLSFIQRAAPHVWLFGSLFGIPMSGTLALRAWRQRRVLYGGHGVQPISDFWVRQSLWFLAMHISYVYIGIIAILGVRSEWAQKSILLVLVATPLILTFRAYAALRLRGDAHHG